MDAPSAPQLVNATVAYLFGATLTSLALVLTLLFGGFPAGLVSAEQFSLVLLLTVAVGGGIVAVPLLAVMRRTGMGL